MNFTLNAERFQKFEKVYGNDTEEFQKKDQNNDGKLIYWDIADLNSFDWDTAWEKDEFTTGFAAFGNPYTHELPYNPLWEASTDSALYTIVDPGFNPQLR